ncbi:MAG: septum formation initiator family protein [Acidobacteriota bacterium]
MKFSSSIKRNLLILILSAMGLSFIVISVFGEKGLMSIYRVRRSLECARAEIEEVRRGNEKLRREIDRLQNDPTSSEEIARRELGLIRKDEVLVIVQDRKAGTPAPPSR